ncbi:DEAD/DEAH box helicase [Exilibacterium tricleocarpae]|uniref:DEAD/DEAH box helicase n=1 Tax=Exilibacterium tricleocarpae TaxID=2591008 RepID=A0A545SYT6_9GAMM|nr:DEAD/DEAH box helicase [Exilibacterium tricleocarpae]TQV70135.1 DEAD/DEAH box helicase [Exilibacterium tricleocarpae]
MNDSTTDSNTDNPESAGFETLALDPRLLKALAALGFEQPTPVQRQVLPAAAGGRDMMVSAATGSGKTAAYMLPTLHRLLTTTAPATGTRALILSPTRELARQVLKHTKQLAAGTGLRAEAITGGADFTYQRAVFRKDPDIIIATPGRLLEHVQRNNADFNELAVLVVDEADRMLDMGFADDVLAVVKQCSKHRQTLLFSATLSGKQVAAMAAQVLNDPHKISLNSARMDAEHIRHQVVLADSERHKDQLLNWLLAREQFAKALVFTNTKTQASRLRGLMAYHQHRVGALHGDMEQVERNRMLDRFRRGQIDVLVATDVAARGLDIKGVELVINYEFARSGDDYIHRVGRTGRAGEHGLAISLVEAREWNLKAGIERYLDQKLEPRKIQGLEGSYKGPKKVKASGKSAGSKKKKADKKTTAKKPKQRARDQKNIGKRKTPRTQAGPGADLGDGFTPFKKR